jgi:hypothetical protein
MDEVRRRTNSQPSTMSPEICRHRSEAVTIRAQAGRPPLDARGWSFLRGIRWSRLPAVRRVGASIAAVAGAEVRRCAGRWLRMRRADDRGVERGGPFPALLYIMSIIGALDRVDRGVENGRVGTCLLPMLRLHRCLRRGCRSVAGTRTPDAARTGPSRAARTGPSTGLTDRRGMHRGCVGRPRRAGAVARRPATGRAGRRRHRAGGPFVRVTSGTGGRPPCPRVPCRLAAVRRLRSSRRPWPIRGARW